MDGASTSDGSGDGAPELPGDQPSDQPSDQPVDQFVDEPGELAAGQPGRATGNASLRQLSLNVVSSYGTFAVGVVLSLLLTRVLLLHLGAGTYGLWIVLLALVSYLGLLDVGIGTAAVQRIARLTAIDDKAGIADLIRTTWVVFALSGAVAVLVTIGLAPFVASLLNLGTISSTQAGATLVILGVMSAISFLAIVPNSVLFGSGRSDRLSQIGLIALLFTQVGQILAVLASGGLIVLAIFQAAGIAISFCMASSVVRRVTGVSLRHGRFSVPLLKDLLRFGGLQSVVTLSSVFAFQLDALIIGILLPVAQVAPYSVALNTSNFTRSLANQGSALLLPTYSHFDAVADRRRQAKYFFNGVMASLVISVPVIVSLAAFGGPLLKLWLGTVPPKSYEIVIALGVVNALQFPGHQCFLFLTGVGRNRQLVKWAVIGAVANLAGSIVATYLLGPIGPAIGSIPVVLVLDFTILPIMVCRYLEVPVGTYVRKALGPVLIVGVAAAAVALALLRFHPVHSGLAAIVASVIVCGAAWAIFILVLARVEPELRTALTRRLRPGRS